MLERWSASRNQKIRATPLYVHSQDFVLKQRGCSELEAMTDATRKRTEKYLVNERVEHSVLDTEHAFVRPRATLLHISAIAGCI